MDQQRILITGANGQLGTALKQRYPKALATDAAELDITNRAELQAFDWSRIDTIINAAAYTNVDGAESADGRRAAWQVNAAGAANLARVAITRDLTIVHISTEYVFDGSISPHKEEEPATPLGVYGQTKTASDIAVGLAPRHYIVRVSWLIGEGNNFVRTMAGLAAKNISPKVVDDQIGRLTFTDDLARGIEHLLTTKAPAGTYNLTGDGQPASWAQVTRAIFAELGRHDLTVTPISTADYFADKPEVAPRPLQSTLELAKIKATGFTLPDWRDALKQYLAKEQGHLAN